MLTFKLRYYDNSQHEVTARRIFEAYGEHFAVHRPLNMKNEEATSRKAGYCVTHIATGRGLGYGRTIKEAEHRARVLLDSKTDEQRASAFNHERII